MTSVKRLIVLALTVIAGVAGRMIIKYGVQGALDLVLNAAHAQSAPATPATRPALHIVPPRGKGPINAARAAVAAENKQLVAQTGPHVPPPTPAPAGSSAPPAAAPAVSKPAAPVSTPAAKPAVASVTPAGARPVAMAGAPAGARAVPPGARAARDTASVSQQGVAKSAADSARSLVMRETFEYNRDARRDPFVSLMTTSDLRPTLSDLQLKGVLYDLSGRRPIAILRDEVGGQWRVTTGMTLGRMRVAQIKPRTVIFTIEEFGFSRQDSLLLGDTTRVRSR